MELLLMNYLEESKECKYNDVEIVDYSIDGTDCEVTFTHTDYKSYETVWGCIYYKNYFLGYFISCLLS